MHSTGPLHYLCPNERWKIFHWDLLIGKKMQQPKRSTWKVSSIYIWATNNSPLRPTPEEWNLKWFFRYVTGTILFGNQTGRCEIPYAEVLKIWKSKGDIPYCLTKMFKTTTLLALFSWPLQKISKNQLEAWGPNRLRLVNCLRIKLYQTQPQEITTDWRFQPAEQNEMIIFLDEECEIHGPRLEHLCFWPPGHPSLRGSSPRV